MKKLDWKVTDHDRDILLGLAQRVRVIADSPRNQEIVQQWYLHDDCKAERPLVLTETDGGLNLVEPDFKLHCHEGWARNQEYGFLDTLIHVERIGDDWPVDPYVNCGWDYQFSDYTMS